MNHLRARAPQLENSTQLSAYEKLSEKTPSRFAKTYRLIEYYWHPPDSGTLGSGELGKPVGGHIQGLTSFYSPDGTHHVIVSAVLHGSWRIQEFHWNPSTGSGVQERELHQSNDQIWGIAGYSLGPYRHLILAFVNNPQLVELRWTGNGPPERRVIGDYGANWGGLSAFTSSDGVAHVAFAKLSADGTCFELFDLSTTSSGQRNLSNLGAMDQNIDGFCGFHTPDTKRNLIVCVSNRGHIFQAEWGAGMSPKVTTPFEPPLTSPPIRWSKCEGIGGFCSPDGVRHIVGGDSDGRVRELWWSPSSGARDFFTFGQYPYATATGFYSADGWHHGIALVYG